MINTTLNTPSSSIYTATKLNPGGKAIIPKIDKYIAKSTNTDLHNDKQYANNPILSSNIKY